MYIYIYYTEKGLLLVKPVKPQVHESVMSWSEFIVNSSIPI